MLMNEVRCLRWAIRAWKVEVRLLMELAQTWNRLAAERESDEALFQVISEIELGEPYEALPRALRLQS